MNTNLSLSQIRSIVLVICFAAVCLIIGIVAGKYFSSGISFNNDSYQAVFLTNNQVYFGKLSDANSEYPVLTDVYYIQAFAPQDLSNPTRAENNLQLVKLGSELHQPQGVMYLNRNQILFIEPLKPDSKIIKAINGFK
jgi:hypothetical protein